MTVSTSMYCREAGHRRGYKGVPIYAGYFCCWSVCACIEHGRENAYCMRDTLCGERRATGTRGHCANWLRGMR